MVVAYLMFSQLIKDAQSLLLHKSSQNSVCISDRHNEKAITVMGTGTAYLDQVQRVTSRHNVSRTSTGHLEEAQRYTIANRSSVSQTGTAHLEQAQRITKRHNFLNAKTH